QTKNAFRNAQPGCQLVFIEWFVDEIVSPGFHPLEVTALAAHGCEQNDVGVPRIVQSAHASPEFQSVQTRHHHVGDQDGNVCRVKFLVECCLALPPTHAKV